MSEAENTPSRKNGRPKGYITFYKPQAKTQALLGQVLEILEEYRDYLPMTVRQIFYRLVGAYGYPKDEAAYSRLGEHLSKARRAQVIPFEAIRDDGVVTTSMNHFADKEAFLRHVRMLGENYERNMLEDQNFHMEVWCEASGMLQQLARVSRRYSVRTYSSSGFDSLTAKKDLADRICEIGKPTYILHLGDYDPSGESVFDSIAEDVTAFVERDKPWGGVEAIFHRVALTSDQVDRYRLPTAPPKKTDSRTARWKGETCQLEALPPDQISEILRAKIEEIFDLDELAYSREQQVHERMELTRLLPAPA